MRSFNSDWAILICSWNIRIHVNAGSVSSWSDNTLDYRNYNI